MTVRGVLGVTVAVGYVAVLAHATVAAGRCPVREPGACQRVHTLLTRAPLRRDFAAAMPVPMSARSSHGEGQDAAPMLVAAAEPAPR